MTMERAIAVTNVDILKRKWLEFHLFEITASQRMDNFFEK